MGSDVTLFLPSPNNIEIEKSITGARFYMLLSFAESGKKHIYTHMCVYIYIYIYIYVYIQKHIL